MSEGFVMVPSGLGCQKRTMALLRIMNDIVQNQELDSRAVRDLIGMVDSDVPNAVLDAQQHIIELLISLVVYLGCPIDALLHNASIAMSNGYNAGAGKDIPYPRTEQHKPPEHETN